MSDKDRINGMLGTLRMERMTLLSGTMSKETNDETLMMWASSCLTEAMEIYRNLHPDMPAMILVARLAHMNSGRP